MKKIITLTLVVLMLLNISPLCFAAEEVPIIDDIWEVIDDYSGGYDSTLFLFYDYDTQTLTVSDDDYVFDFQKRDWGLPSALEPTSFKQLCIDRSVKHLVIEKGVKYISNSFNDLSALEDVSLPAGLEKISQSFNGCPNLKSISFAKKFDQIDKDSFRDCPAVQTVYINKKAHSKEWMDKNLFIQPTVFYEFDEPTATLTVSGKGAVSHYQPRDWWANYSGDDGNFRFVAEDTTVKHLIIKEGITDIFNSFNDMVALETVRLPNSLKTIQESFQGCKKIQELTFPKRLKTIYSYSFNDCPALKKITFQSAIEISAPNTRQVFCNLPSLKTIYLPEGSSLQGLIFCRCENLSVAQLGGPKVTIHHDEGMPFRACPKLRLYGYENHQAAFSGEQTVLTMKDSDRPSPSMLAMRRIGFWIVILLILLGIGALIYFNIRKARQARIKRKTERNPEW